MTLNTVPNISPNTIRNRATHGFAHFDDVAPLTVLDVLNGSWACLRDDSLDFGTPDKTIFELMSAVLLLSKNPYLLSKNPCCCHPQGELKGMVIKAIITLFGLQSLHFETVQTSINGVYSSKLAQGIFDACKTHLQKAVEDSPLNNPNIRVDCHARGVQIFIAHRDDHHTINLGYHNLACLMAHVDTDTAPSVAPDEFLPHLMALAYSLADY